MHSTIRGIIEAYNPSLLIQLDSALKLRVTNFKRDLFPRCFRRILGSQVLERGGILEQYMEAINEVHSKGIVYYFPEDSDPGDDSDAWPLQSDLSELEYNSEESHY